MSPYRVVDASETEVIYEYRTAYTWSLYAVLVVFIVGMVMENDTIAKLAGVGAAIYFAAKYVLGSKVNSQIRHAMQSGGVKITGSRSSFNNPLRIRVSKSS